MIDFSNEVRGDGLFSLSVSEANPKLVLSAPRVELDGQMITLAVRKWSSLSTQRVFRDCHEHLVEGPVVDQPGLTLRVIYRQSKSTPVIRFRFELSSEKPRIMTKSTGSDRIEYFSFEPMGYQKAKEVQLSDFHELNHSFGLREMELEDHHFNAGLNLMGPIFCFERESESALFAYEHGSMVPDAYLNFELNKTGDFPRVGLAAVKGNYLKNETIDSDHSFESIWFHAAAVEGDEDALAATYRDFILKHLAAHEASREPLVFYNTWNYQERLKHHHQKPYLAEMNQTRIEAEIDAAHEMGIDVFVIDTGWYSKTGDWRVNLERFPDKLQSIKKRLDGYGMKLGLWFDNAAAVSSESFKNHEHCILNTGTLPDAHEIWETEASHRLCFVSDYWKSFADTLIRLNREVGVTYFKWDAIGQYGCSDPRHLHGREEDAQRERSEALFFFAAPLHDQDGRSHQ